ncbi:MAG: SIMPL domain-containing protein [Tetrasphaera sp.]
MDAFVEMTGTGSASAAPDVVALDLGVRCPGKSVASALSEADAAMGGIIDAAKEGGVAARDLQTTGASVYPQYDKEGVGVVGYVASQSLRLRVRDRDRVGGLISAFSSVAGNRLTLDNIALLLDDPTGLLEQARAAAFANAHDKARQFAALAGRELGPVLFVVDTPSGPTQPFGSARQAAGYAMKAEAADMSVEAGENSVTATVVVRWAWA